MVRKGNQFMPEGTRSKACAYPVPPLARLNGIACVSTAFRVIVAIILAI